MVYKEVKTDGKVYLIGICQNEEGTYQFINLTKNKICPCKFANIEEALKDLGKYFEEGKVKSFTVYLDDEVQ